MKITQEDIKKFGTVKEQSQLEGKEMGDLYYYLQSMYEKMDWDMGSEEIISILNEVYDAGYDKGQQYGSSNE